MTPAVKFGYAGQWSANPWEVQRAAQLVKSDPTPVGVEGNQSNLYASPVYRVVSNNEYWQAAQTGRLMWSA